jgi:hypothetical protein
LVNVQFVREDIIGRKLDMIESDYDYLYSNIWYILSTKLGDNVTCDFVTDQIMDVINKVIKDKE